mmetsp:Transcript_20719/g.60033  ORF Transcript_20719/g.60033 Transcript_20719/m.60033 type:complete len:240 (-) Transcript_20719:129-848(-)
MRGQAPPCRNSCGPTVPAPGQGVCTTKGRSQPHNHWCQQPQPGSRAENGPMSLRRWPVRSRRHGHEGPGPRLAQPVQHHGPGAVNPPPAQSRQAGDPTSRLPAGTQTWLQWTCPSRVSGTRRRRVSTRCARGGRRQSRGHWCRWLSRRSPCSEGPRRGRQAGRTESTGTRSAGRGTWGRVVRRCRSCRRRSRTSTGRPERRRRWSPQGTERQRSRARPFAIAGPGPRGSARRRRVRGSP